MVVLQRTLKKSVLFEGVGVHSGKDVTVEILPAPAGHGIKFQRTDIDENPTIPALWSYVTDTHLCTKISGSNTSIGTIEHLMAALAAQKVDNALIKISGAEVPIMDGSARPFLEKISDVGTLAQTTLASSLLSRKQ